ncbi:hypothetical protein NFI96_021962 [Prochilodus magdalenae]|nr:hypothetical protein NFI96_021962 [Prochilodus magdalenae]
MNNAVALFLNTVERANGLVQTGCVLQDQLTPVHPLSTPAKKVILSNIPPTNTSLENSPGSGNWSPPFGKPPSAVNPPWSDPWSRSGGWSMTYMISRFWVDEGGQGLVHLASRTAVFRLQLIDRLLTGPESIVWRIPVSRVLQTVEGLGLDRALFLLDTRTLYKELFKIWELFILHRESCSSLHWLLEEPLVDIAHLDISSQTSHDLSRILIAAGVTKLGQLVGLAGPELTNAENFAAQLGMRSLRVVSQLLYRWSSVLTSDERLLLKDCATGVSTEPAEGDSFPKCTVSPNLGDCGGPLLHRGSRHGSGGSQY